MRKISSATEVLDKRIGDDPELRRIIAEETVNAKVAQEIYDLRTKAGLTQSDLARRVGTTQPVIARLEDADYRGRSLRMLIRIASGQRTGSTLRQCARRHSQAFSCKQPWTLSPP